MNSPRYDRQIILPEIGLSGQDKLQKAKVMVVGVGGLGTAILPYLAGAGIGEIGVIDHDFISISNLQRQVIYKTSALGKSKVNEAKTFLLELNPEIKVNAIHEKLSHENALLLFQDYDIVIDATDNLNTKYLINDACCVLNKPFVYGSLHKFQGQVSVFNYQNGPTYRCLFSQEEKETKNCNETGVLGVSAGIIGMFQANEVLKIIIGIGEVLSGKILIYNLLNNEHQKISFSKDVSITIDASFFKQHYTTKDQDFEIEASEALKEINNPKVLFLDVRNHDELPHVNLPNYQRIPLNNIENQLETLQKNSIIYVFCQSGIRSRNAVELLIKNGFTTVKSISGGIFFLT
jgi:sulfur-carrier protein adenylyltransferase/sulfurtransferase